MLMAVISGDRELEVLSCSCMMGVLAVVVSGGTKDEWYSRTQPIEC